MVLCYVDNIDVCKTIFLDIRKVKKMNILSLDMSTRKTGWAIFNNSKLIAYNLIESSKEDMFQRLEEMYSKIQELITSYNIQQIVCEDVPVSMHSNLKTGKDLCVLQGCILSIAFGQKIKYELLKPTVWRANIGLNHTLYKCKVCGHEKEDLSGMNLSVCSQCGNKDKKQLEKIALNDRESLKKRAVEYANGKFGLDLKYVSKNSKKNDDDIAEAILIGYSFLGGK